MDEVVGEAVVVIDDQDHAGRHVAAGGAPVKAAGHRAGRRRGPAAPLRLGSRGLQGARAALAAPERRRLRTWRVLACAGLMTAAALGLCAVVVLGAGAPQAQDAAPSAVRAALSR